MVALVWRVAKLKFGAVDFIPNFAPWMALSFAGGALLQRRLPGWIWSVVLVLCDLACCGFSQLQYTWTVFACYFIAGLAAGWVQKRASITAVLGGTVASSALFYFVTNTQAWLTNPVYSKNMAGWFQAVTVGDPQYQPQTWVFGLNSLTSDLVFAALLVAAYNFEAVWRKAQTLSLWHRPQAA